MIIAIDFDGTIVKHKFPEIGEEIEEAFFYMKSFIRLGAKLILNTMRSDGPPRNGREMNVLTEAVEFCRSRGIEFYGVNTNPQQKHWTSSPKVYAHLYVDDANFGCPLICPLNDRPYVDWSRVGPDIVKLLEKEQK